MIAGIIFSVEIVASNEMPLESSIVVVDKAPFITVRLVAGTAIQIRSTEAKVEVLRQNLVPMPVHSDGSNVGIKICMEVGILPQTFTPPSCRRVKLVDIIGEIIFVVATLAGPSGVIEECGTRNVKHHAVVGVVLIQVGIVRYVAEVLATVVAMSSLDFVTA
jgi:hypothetical protein